ncbi:MAG: transposase [Chloroflexi bacterium]|nr:transposase [Chloroflexota bacterium]
MTTEAIIIHIFCSVDDRMKDVRKHGNATLYPSEVVTIGILFALKGGHFRAFYRWLKRDYDALFGGLPDRTRLLRLLKHYQGYGDRFLDDVSFFTVADSFPIELIFPIRHGRSDQQVGQKNQDKGRWSIGIKVYWILNNGGRVVGWQWLPMNAHVQHFNAEIAKLDQQSITLTDLGFRGKDGVPDNLKWCEKGTWHERMIIETAFSMLTVVCHMKKIFHRVAAYIEARLAYTMTMFNVLLALYHQRQPDEPPHKMSIAEFSL